MTITFIILGISIILFVSGKIRPDIVAITSMMALSMTGVLTVNETFSGFSNTSIILIAGLFIVGEAMSRAGLTAWLGNKIITLSKNNSNQLLILIIIGSAILSAFMSNTGTVASLMPVIIAAAWRLKTPASKMLIPLSFAAATGGLLTLTGTPTNIITNQAMIDAGVPEFGFFEFAYIGVPLLILTVIYMRYFGTKLLPSNKSRRLEDIDESIQNIEDSYQLYEGFWKVRIRPNSSAIGKTIKQMKLGSTMGVNIIKIISKVDIATSILKKVGIKKGDLDEFPDLDREFHAEDELIVNCSENRIHRFIDKYNVAATKLEGVDVKFIKENVLSDEVGICELIIAPKSSYKGKHINTGRFGKKYNLQVIAVSRYNKRIRGREFDLQEGDSILVRAKWEDIKEIQEESRDFLIIGSPEELSKEVGTITRKGVISILAMVFMVLMFIWGPFSSSITVMLTAFIMIAGGCINMNQSYRSINWNVITIMAGMIPMGVALQKTGGAKFIADSMISMVGEQHPTYFLAGIFLITSFLSQVMSNTATAILMAPIVLVASLELGYSPQPFMMALAVSASTAFLTPFGTPTNTMVMNAGNYKFTDYLKSGAFLLLIFFIVSIVMIPMIWPYN
ncbi:SLC13 family permease [Polaribacter sargassicola]|uniref:SLC13 family permease n=1 Tax=Polaribacter sargassicola TaxID=2836891 RepID=UPI001F27ED91|nr:SLC13 family permease [Polaribacter sp. DS7-9]MCG1035134.1 anion permease [Polaribacter sp. DS7-9]